MKLKRSWHDIGVITRTTIVIFMMLTSGCFLDSDDYLIFMGIIAFGIIYLTIFSIVNKERWKY